MHSPEGAKCKRNDQILGYFAATIAGDVFISGYYVCFFVAMFVTIATVWKTVAAIVMKLSGQNGK